MSKDQKTETLQGNQLPATPPQMGLSLEQKKEIVLAQEMRVIAQVKTYNDIVLAKSMRLDRLSETLGEDIALSLVINSISEMCSVMAFETTPEMILTVSQMILEDFPDTKFAAFQIFKKEVLYGRIGKPGKTFRMDAKVLLEFWSEFYSNMSNIIADHIEARNKEFFPPEQPINKDKIVPMPENVKANLERLSKKLTLDAQHKDENRLRPQNRKIPLEEIAEMEGIDIVELAACIKMDAEATFKTGEVKLKFDQYLIIKTGQITFEARKREGFLKEYITYVKEVNKTRNDSNG